MCGRYYLELNSLEKEKYALNAEINYETNFNITPQSQVPIVINDELIMGTWGYFPDWLKKQKNSKPLFNTRWETIKEKRTFQSAYKKNRCLVPLSGWYEWKNVNDEKHPYYFFGNEKLVHAAGLYWKRSSGDLEFSIITQDAYGDLASIHNRTPLLLSKKNEEKWIANYDVDLLYEEISENTQTLVNFHRVTKAVNNPKNKNSSLINEYTEVPF